MRWGFAGMLVLVGAAVAAGCGGSSSKPSATPTSASATTSRADALTRSSANVAKATSFSATFHANVQTGSKTIVEDGDMAARGSTFDMKLNVAGQQMEILVSPPDEYIDVPGKGWYSMGDAVFNQQAFAQYAKNRGPIDYAGIVSSLESSRQLPDDTIDGKTYTHFTGTFDIKKAMASIPSDVLKPGVAAAAESFNMSPGSLDIWLDASTGFPRRVAETMSMTVAGSDMVIDMTMDYTSWSGDVDISPAPADAKPYSDLMGGMSMEEAAYELKFASWIAQMGSHMQAELSHMVDDRSTPTAGQRATWNKFVTDFQNDVATLKAMEPPDRFRPSYDKFSQAMDSFSIVVDEVGGWFAGRGSPDETRATQSETDFEKQVSVAFALFKSESQPSSSAGAPTPSTTP